MEAELMTADPALLSGSQGDFTHADRRQSDEPTRGIPASIG
jgi:hypothetical protein